MAARGVLGINAVLEGLPDATELPDDTAQVPRSTGFPPDNLTICDDCSKPADWDPDAAIVRPAKSMATDTTLRVGGPCSAKLGRSLLQGMTMLRNTYKEHTHGEFTRLTYQSFTT